MKAKQIFWPLAVLVICSIFSLSQGADTFYYGTYGGRPDSDLGSMKDSLKFNIVVNHVKPSEIQSYADTSLRAIVSNTSDQYSPSHRASYSYYTLWEAEGYPGSYYEFDYTGGTLVSDPYASGGQARKFSPRSDPTDTVIQRGPGYDQEYKNIAGTPIQYTAEFRLKALHTGIPHRSSGSSEPLCSLKVVGHDLLDNETLLAHKVVYTSAFENFTGYKTFEIEDYTILHPEDSTVQNPIEFQIYWFGNRTLYIDYVKVYNEYGWLLIEQEGHPVAEQIKAYVDSPWVHTTLPNGDTAVYHWYLRDEPGSIDLFEPARYIDSLLREVSTERVGFQAFNRYSDDIFEHEYFLRQNPEEYHVDVYPMRWLGQNFSGETFQQILSYYISLLNTSKSEAEDRQKDFWVTIAAFVEGPELDSGETCCQGCSLYYEYLDTVRLYCFDVYKRLPTPYEVRLQTFLAFCYGADAILNFWYESRNWLRGEKWYLMLGLYDYMGDSTTAMWREIRDFTGPRVEALGPMFNQLTWQGACSDDEVGSFVLRNGESSYIDSITGRVPDSTYVEVGFFEGYGVYEGDYFTLVNRRCLETEHETLSVYFPTMPDGPYLVIDIFEPDYPVGKICGISPYISISLKPGEGRLFRLEKYHFVIDVPSEYSTIQSAIDVSNWAITILVAPGTYYENIDFNGRNPTVASYLHSTGDTAYISQTIIDGSMPADSEFASVVRFVSGEASCATLKGFTIRNGTGTIYIDKSEPGKYGGGIYCWDSSPTIMNNVIIGDTVTTSGGGIYCRNSSPQILNNLIKENEADWDGGGIAIETDDQESSDPILLNNVIVDNASNHYGGGIYYR